MDFSLPVKRIDKAIVYLGFEKCLNQIPKLKSVSKDEEDSFKANLLATAHDFCNISLDQNSMMNNKEKREGLKKI